MSSAPPPPPPPPTPPVPQGPSTATGGAAPPRTLPEAVQTCLSKYATFSGRASRSEYWYWLLATLLTALIAAVADGVLFAGDPILSGLLMLGVILPSVAAAVRRLHDTGRSGWWFLVSFIPFGSLALLILLCLPGDPHHNEYG